MSDAGQRIYELMVLTAWADGKIEAAEALAVHEIVAADPHFKDLGKRSEIAKAVKARIDEKGLDAALREAAAAIPERADREVAFRYCAKVLDAGAELGAEEAEVLATLQELFALSGDDVKRLMRDLHG